MTNIEASLQTETNTLKNFDTTLKSLDDIQKHAQEFFSSYQRLEGIKVKIQTLDEGEKKNELSKRLDTIYMMMYDLFDNANIDNSVIKNLNTVSENFKKFIIEYNKTVRKDIEIAVGGNMHEQQEIITQEKSIGGKFVRYETKKYAHQYQGKNVTVLGTYQVINLLSGGEYNGGTIYIITGENGNIIHTTEIKRVETGSETGPIQFSLYGLYEVKYYYQLGDDIITKYSHIESEFSITTTNGKTLLLKESELKFNRQSDGSVVVEYNGSIVQINEIYNIIAILGDGTQKKGNSNNIKQIELSTDDYQIMKYGFEGFQKIQLGNKILSIFNNKEYTYTEKYKEVLDIGQGLQTNEDKIQYAAFISSYFQSIYDNEQYESKKQVFNGFLKDKSSSTEELYTKETAGVCADHHIAVAQLLSDLGINAGVVSLTSTGLHAITRAKNGDEFILIDYGQVYTSKSSEDLLAKYYALHKSTPKPFDIVTGPDGKIIGTISTPLGKLIEKNLSPFQNGKSSNVATDWSKNRGNFYQKGYTLDGSINNQNQGVNIDYAFSKNKKMLLEFERTIGIDDSSLNFASLEFDKLSKSGKNETTVKGTMNNVNRNKNEQPLDKPGVITSPSSKNINSATALGISFGHKKRLNDWDIGNTNLHPAMASQVGLQFDNIESPGFIANSAFAVTSDQIKLGPKTNVSFQTNLQGDYLPNRIDTPVNTMHIKPTLASGVTVSQSIGSSQLKASGNVGVTRYNAGAHNISYEGDLTFKNKRLEINTGVEGNQQQNTNTILTNRLIGETKVQYRPNILGDKLSIFGGYNTTFINGSQNSQQFNAGAKYNLQ